MNRPLARDEKPSLVKAAPHIERRMEGQTGSVTLHFVRGTFKKTEYRMMEDAESIPVVEPGR